jgi:DNA mismatch repair endonuclease MutH
MNFEIESYDRTNPGSIEAYAQKLIGKSFQEIINEDEVKEGELRASEDKKNKGNLGQIVEERFFHYACNSDSNPDFEEAGVELKVTPYKINPNGKKVAKERLILTMIDYCSVVNEDFETSHLWNKSKLILLVYYLYQKEMEYNVDYRINYAKLFTPPEQDLKIIKHDYETIVSKIRAGKAHELSEADTMYLGAATKAATSADRRKQPFSDEPAKPRAFSFKNSYMTYVLNNYVIPGKSTYEPIIRENVVESFEDYVRAKIDKLAGYSTENLCTKYDIEVEKKPKNLEAVLAYRILGIRGNHAEEFEKANIVVKTIRIGKNNKIRESMSFPAFRFTEIIRETWEESTFANYLEQTRFLFVVYKYDKNDALVLKGCQFWNIPYQDLQEDVRSVWEKTVKVIRNGLQIVEKNGKRSDNFPNASENKVCHVRPHGQTTSDTYPLPDGREYTKQCFWLKNTYIQSQLDKRFFEDL